MNHKKRSLFTKKQSRTVKRKFKKNGLLFANAALIVVVTGFVWVGHNGASSTQQPTLAMLNSNTQQDKTAPLDSLSSADIAANIALATSMPEEIMVVNQADSYAAQLSQATTEESVVAKPQVVTGAAVSKNDIKPYVAQQGDSVAKVAEQFGVSADSIKWSNGLTTDAIPAGKELTVPPVNGVVYTVKDGDTIESLASKYKVSTDTIITDNDIELTGLNVGTSILITGGQAPAAPRTTSSRSVTKITGSSAAAYGFTAQYGGNGYYRGYCTWYAASRVAVPSNWGNANTWDNRARSSGWTVSSNPVAGAIFQTDNGWAGHVGIVEEVHGDGTMTVSDMNGFSGFGRVGYARVPVNQYPNYIYR